jgi:CzcA family heavy metal efflux pump
MMRWIVGSSLKFRRLIVAAAAGALILGITQLGNTRVDILPEFSPTRVEVQTEALGLSAEEMEELITVPLEQDLLNGLAFLDEIESATIPGLSSIVLTFEPGTDLLDARQVVQERLSEGVGAAGTSVAKPHRMLQPLSSTSRVSMVRLSSDELSPIQMSVLARWVISPRLLGVEGVANISIWGYRDRQLQVLVDPNRLRENGVSLNQIIQTTGNALEVTPLKFLENAVPGTGGFIDTVNQRLNVFHEAAISTPDELEQVTIEDGQGGAVFRGDQPLTLGQVTDVVEGHQPLIGDAICPDGQCIMLVVEKFPGANTLEVTRGVEAAFDALRPGLGDIEIDTSVYRPATYLESSFGNLARYMLIGGVLLLLLLGAFFFEWRSALISAVVIPISLITAGLVLYFRGATVNVMVVLGLVMALGAVIDDVVVDLGNLVRRLRQHRSEGSGAPTWKAILEATLETRSAIFFATLIVIAALLPAFFLTGQSGAFLPSVAVSYVLAVAASMVVALTLTPALGILLLPDAKLERRESPAVRWLQHSYHKVFSGIRNRPRSGYVVFGAIVVAGLVALPFLDTSLRPSLKEREVLVHLEAAPGTSLPRMNEITARAIDQLGSVDGVEDVGAHVGRAVLSDQIVDVNSGEIWVKLDPAADYDTAVGQISNVVGRYRGVTSNVLTYSQERATDVLDAPEKDVAVRVYGDSEDVLSEKANELRALLAGIDGVQTPKVELQSVQPTIEVEVDLARAQASGIKPGDVRRASAVLLSGITAGNLFEEQKVFDVTVWGTPEIRQDIDDVRNLLIEAPGGEYVRVGDVADVRIAENPTVIRHESVSKYLDVTASVAGRSVASVASDIEQALGRVSFPLDYHAEVLADSSERGAARTRLLTVAVAAALGIFLLLQAAFGSWRLATLVFLALPMALAGGFVAAAVSGGTISLGSLAGLTAVLGIAARGAVVLIRHYQTLHRREGQPFGAQLVLRGTRDRVAPVVMTALATIVALLPLVFAGDAVGLEIVRPMAIVMFGGLITSTLLTLFVLPSLYLRHGFTEPDTSTEDLFVTIPEVEVEASQRVVEGTTLGEVR